MNESADGWDSFREFAAEWAVKRGESLEHSDELDQQFRAALAGIPANQDLPAESIQRLAVHLQNTFERSRLETLVRMLRESARSVPYHCWRESRVSLESVQQALAKAQSAKQLFCIQLPQLSESAEKVFRQSLAQGVEERVSAESVAADFHRYLGGFLPSRFGGRIAARPRQLFFALLSLPEAVRVLAIRAYEERYRRPFQEVASENMKPLHAAAIIKLADKDTAGAVLRYLAAEHVSDEQELAKLEKALWQLPRRERRRIYLKFNATREHELPAALQQAKLSDDMRALLRLLMNGSPAEFDARRILSDLNARRFESIARRLLARDQKERRSIEYAFASISEYPLREQLQTALPQDGLREWAIALLDDDEHGALVWRGRSIIHRQTDEWLGHFLRGPARENFIRGYADSFGERALESDIKSRYHGRDQEIVLDLLEHGAVSWGKLLWFSVAGPGTDEEALIALLEDTGSETQARLKEEYRAIWQERAPWYERLFPNLFGNLEKRLWIECAGDSWCDLKEFLRAPNPQGDLSLRLERAYQHERSGRLLKRIDFFSHEGRVMDDDVRLARSFYETSLAGKTPSEAEQIYFEVLMRVAESDCSVYRSLKHFIGNNLTTTVAGCGVFCSAIAVSFFSENLLPIMLTVAVTSATLRFCLKSLLKGHGYHRDEMFADLGFACIDGATLYMGRLFRRALLSGGAKFTSRLGLKQSVVQFIRSLHEVSAELESRTLRELADSGTDSESEIPEQSSARVVDPKFYALIAELRKVSSESTQTA